jgi:signal transduction histidine kinase
VRHGADPAVLADIEADAARLAALLDDLLALAREDAATPLAGEPVSLVEVARAAIAADPNARVVVEPGARASGGERPSDRPNDGGGAPPEDDDVHVLGERLALERAVSNLVRNAREHGPPGGAITVIVAGGEERARISVCDEGPGLPTAQAEHAFERFWRGPDAGSGGSGLGLAIVRAIAERHGGRAAIEGSTFIIDLPALRDLSRSRRTTSA